MAVLLTSEAIRANDLSHRPAAAILTGKYIDAAIDILRAQLIGADGFGVDIPGIASAARLDQARILVRNGRRYRSRLPNCT